MKAKVQYNDMTGTAAADISDYYLNSLNEYLSKKYSNFCSEKYYCVGCEFYTSYGQYPSVRFICRDIKNNTYQQFQSDQDFSLVEFFELFKRFSIVLGQSIEDVEINENEEHVLKSRDTNNSIGFVSRK